MKTCKKCHLDKNESEFSKDKNTKDGLCRYCKTCVAGYYIAKREHYLEKQKKYRINNNEYYKTYLKEYYRTHKIEHNNRGRKWARNNREKSRAYNKRWRDCNPDKIVAKVQRRRAMRRKLPSTLTANQWLYVISYFGNKCAYCGKIEKLTQEHFVPLYNGGEYSKNNIIPVCNNCNVSKNRKSFFIWYPKQPFYSKRREEKIYKFLNYKDGIQQLTI